MKKLLAAAALAVAVLAPRPARAADPIDYLEMRDGAVLEGKFMGGTAETVRFETKDGVRVLQRKDILALTFAASPAAAAATAAPAAPPAAPAAAPAAPPAAPAAAPPAPPPAAPNAPAAAPPPAAPPPAPAAPVAQTAPAGTVLLVRMTSTVSSRDAAGKRFSGKLETELGSESGGVIAAAGSAVYGRIESSGQAGRLAGRSGLALSITEVTIGQRTYVVATTTFAEVGNSSFRKTARNAGAGAAIGGAFDGGEGAAKGAAIGAAVSVLRRGDSVTVPAGTLLEFRLKAPFKIGGGS